jgi:hypothetical protein
MATQDEFYRIWQVLVTSYPNWVKDMAPGDLAGTFKVYERLLSDIPGSLLEAAVVQHVASNKWFPAIAELRSLVLAITTPERITAMEAWGSVLDAMKSGGARIMPGGNGYYPPEWADPITARVVASMGWVELCQSDNQEADRAHFMRAYDAIAARDSSDALMLPMMREWVNRMLATSEVKKLEG